MKRIGMLTALVLAVIVNVLVLAGVSYNRSGKPDAVVTLTERELHLITNNKENSGISLKLETQPGYNKWNEESPWFDRKKLEEVGFDCSAPIDAVDAARHYDKELPRRTYVVLENDGQAWESWIAGRAEQLKSVEAQVAEGQKGKEKLDSERRRYRWEREAASRLFAVDVGSDADKLRNRYPDRKKYIITTALVRLRLLRGDENEKMRKPVLSGYVDEILTAAIHVPRDRQGGLASLKPDMQYYYNDGKKDNFNPRYKVTLNYGRRYEPWVVEVIPQ